MMSIFGSERLTGALQWRGPERQVTSAVLTVWSEGDRLLKCVLVLIGQAPSGHRNEWPEYIRERPRKMAIALPDISSCGA
jgi:hypothetical protein